MFKELEWLNFEIQWNGDIIHFGDNAHQMYEYEVNVDTRVGFDSNEEVIDAVEMGVARLYRKQSAELPFNIEDAKLGNVNKKTKGK